MASTERKQVSVPKTTAASSSTPGPTLIVSTNYQAGAGAPGLYRLADRGTPVMADGSMHGKINNVTFRGTNFDGSLNT